MRSRLPAAGIPEESAAERAQQVEMAVQALDALPVDQRQVLILRELDGLSYEQISTVLECTLDTVKSRLHRARHHLLEKSRHFLERQSSL